MKKLRNVFYILSALLVCLFAFNFNFGVAYGSPYYYSFDGAIGVAVSPDGEVVVADSTSLYLLGEDGDGVKTIDFNNATGVLFAGDGFYALGEDKVYSISNDFTGVSQISALDGVSLLTYLDGTFYGVIDNSIVTYDDNFTVVSTTPTVSTPVSVTIVNSQVIYSVSDGAYYSVYSLDGSLFYDRITAYNLVGVDETLYGVDRYGAIVTVSGDGESVYFNDETVKSFTVSGNEFYFISEFDGVYTYDGNNHSLIAGSASSEVGFYNTPTAFVSRLGFSAVSDYLNNRVQITSGDGDNPTVSYFTVTRPTSLAIDNNGLIFVSHSANKISAFTTLGVKSGSDYTLPSAISKVVIGVNNEVYALCSNKVYALSGDEFTLVKEGVDSIWASDGLYYSVGAKIFAPDNSEILSASNDIIAFTCDNAGNYFMLTYNGSSVALVKYEKTSAQFTTVNDGLDGGVSSIFISRTTAGSVNYGDVLLVNGERSCVSVIPCQDALVDNTVAFTPTPTDYDENDIIRTTAFETRLYGSANESNSNILLMLPKNKTLIVLNYDNPQLRGMSYCACVDATGNLVYGYVFRSTLNDPTPYTNPPSSSAIVYAENVKLYSLPSLKSDEIYSFNKDESVTLLPFCEYFDGKNIWYKAQVDAQTVGYVPAYSVSVHNFIPDAPRPQYNATVRSYNNSIFVVCFEKDVDGTFKQIADEILYTGTQIEVIGTFDASQKYTQIKYYDEKLGTLTCYIESIYIEYNSISVVQIVAICVAIATAILLVALLIRVYMKKRKI